MAARAPPNSWDVLGRGFQLAPERMGRELALAASVTAVTAGTTKSRWGDKRVASTGQIRDAPKNANGPGQ